MKNYLNFTNIFCTRFALILLTFLVSMPLLSIEPTLFLIYYSLFLLELVYCNAKKGDVVCEL